MKIAYVALAFLPSLVYAQSLNPPATLREASSIDWKAYQLAVKAAKRQVEKTRSGGFSDAIKKTQLPVLMATHKDVRAAPNFQTQGGSYVAYYGLPGIEIALLGSASQIIASSPSIHAPDPSVPIFEVNEDITDLTFRRFGANYTLRASCKEVNDVRCTAPDFLTQFMQSLVPIGR